jgi:hypothetical protein
MQLRTFALAAAFLAVPSLAVPSFAHSQASAIPSAETGGDAAGADHGRTLLDQMVQALGGEAWLNRSTWVEYGQTAHFYKGTPDPYVTGFEEYYRLNPFAERIIHIEHVSTLAILGLPGHDSHTSATIWNDQGGWDITYKGKQELPKDDRIDFAHLRKHALEVVVKQWLHEPGVLVTYEGTDMVQRRLAEQVSVTDAANDTVTLQLEESTHLPLSLTFKARNDTYHDLDTVTQEFDDYHDVQGIMTPMTLTSFKNGEMVAQRFLKKVDYTVPVASVLFDPDRPLDASTKK